MRTYEQRLISRTNRELRTIAQDARAAIKASKDGNKELLRSLLENIDINLQFIRIDFPKKG